MAPVLMRYSAVTSAISNVSSIDQEGDQSWNAKLRAPDLPQNLLIGVSLRYRRGNGLQGVDTFLERAPKYAKLVLAVPWLNAYLANHTDTTFELRYVNGQSLSTKAVESLVADMRTHGKSKIADLVTRQQADSAFIEINSPLGWSRAVVLPAGEVLLWHFKGDSTLGFAAENRQVWDYYGWNSTGTLVGVDRVLKR